MALKFVAGCRSSGLQQVLIYVNCADLHNWNGCTCRWSFLYIFSLTLPHSTAVQVAWPDQAIKNGEEGQTHAM
jgi:hypothetical protein